MTTNGTVIASIAAGEASAAAGLLAGAGAAAGDRVSLEALGRNAQTGTMRVAVCLDTDKPLVCFSVAKAFDRNGNEIKISSADR
jgi:hypothetical protein